MVDDDRGQLILIAAILVAATIVGSVVLLNSYHSSASVNTVAEGQSLDDTQRVTTDVQEDLEYLFLANYSQELAGKRLPFVEDYADLAALNETYNDQYLNISTTSKSGFTRTELVGTNDDGYALWQNDTKDYKSWDIGSGSSDDLERVLYLKLEISEVDSANNELIAFDESRPLGTSTSQIVVSKNSGIISVTINGDTQCGGIDSSEVDPDNPIEIELIYGEGGQVTAPGDPDCASATGYDLTGVSNSIKFSGSASGEMGIVTADPPSNSVDTTGPNRGEQDNLHVEPEFDIRYEDANVEYSTNVTLFGGDP